MDPGTCRPGEREPGPRLPSGDTALKDSASEAQSSDALALPQPWPQPHGSPVILFSGKEERWVSALGQNRSVWNRPVPGILRVEDVGEANEKHFEALCPISLGLGHKNMPFISLILSPIAPGIKNI